MTRWLQQPPRASWIHFDVCSKGALTIDLGTVLTDKYGPVEHVVRLRGATKKIQQITRCRAGAPL